MKNRTSWALCVVPVLLAGCGGGGGGGGQASGAPQPQLTARMSTGTGSLNAASTKEFPTRQAMTDLLRSGFRKQVAIDAGVGIAPNIQLVHADGTLEFSGLAAANLDGQPAEQSSQRITANSPLLHGLGDGRQNMYFKKNLALEAIEFGHAYCQAKHSEPYPEFLAADQDGTLAVLDCYEDRSKTLSAGRLIIMYATKLDSAGNLQLDELRNFVDDTSQRLSVMYTYTITPGGKASLNQLTISHAHDNVTTMFARLH